MHLITIVWTFICASIIILYTFYLFCKSSSNYIKEKKKSNLLEIDAVELFSYDLQNQLPGWSFTIDIPFITEDVLQNSNIFFYLESENSCLKLPLNNGTLGYAANAHKNVGRTYLVFKSLSDGVSNFYVPSWHLRKLKIVIIKSQNKSCFNKWEAKLSNSILLQTLTKDGVNVNDYEDMLGYLSNISPINFKGHFSVKSKIDMTKKKHKIKNPNQELLTNIHKPITILT